MLRKPYHQVYKEMTARLSDPLVKEYGVKRLPVRKGDSVMIMRGDYAGHEGEVVDVDLKRRRIHVDGVTRTKADGSTIFIPIHPSKVMITKLNLSDKWRKKIIERRKK